MLSIVVLVYADVINGCEGDHHSLLRRSVYPFQKIIMITLSEIITTTPFLGFVNEKPTLILNHEVEKEIEVLVSDLLDDANISAVTLDTSYMEKAEVPCFKINNHVIWGATGMMLSEIKELLK